MSRTTALIALTSAILTLAAGCEDLASSADDADAQASQGATDPLPAQLNVDITALAIGPGKADSTQWDGFGDLNEDFIQLMAQAAGLPFNDLLGQMGGAAAAALEKPDPSGWVERNDGASWQLVSAFDKRQDSFQPTLSPSITVQGLPSGRGMLRITVVDEDLSFDDDIGTVTLQASDLEEAWRAGGSVWINVADQTRGQLLLVQVNVYERASGGAVSP